MSISNKIIYVTGGSTGIGLSIALELASTHNNTICLFARDLAKLEHARMAVSAAGAQCHIYSVDACDYEAVKRTMNHAVRTIGAPDILVNCVGRAIPYNFEEISGPMMMDTMHANFGSTWNAVHTLLPYMKAKGGRIINTSSIGGFVGVFGYTDYSASKFAIVGFSESLRQELRKFNIKVQVLCPPDTDTPGLELENRTKPEETKMISQSAKLMSPQQVASRAVKAMERNNFMIIPGFDGKLAFWLKRYLPFVMDWILDNAINKVQTQQVHSYTQPAERATLAHA